MESVQTLYCVLPRGLLLFFAIVHSVFAGAYYGFVQIASSLTSLGAFSNLCALGAESCDAQAAAISSIYTYASVPAFALPLFGGFLAARAGTRVTLIVLACVSAVGWALLFASIGGDGRVQNQNLLMPAFVCIGASSAASYLPLLSVASLFPSSRALVLSLLSGSFDSGSVVFLVIRAAYSSGTPLRSLLIGVLAGPVALTLLGALVLWRAAPFSDLAQEVTNAAQKTAVEDLPNELNAAPPQIVIEQRSTPPSPQLRSSSRGGSVPSSPRVIMRTASLTGDSFSVLAVEAGGGASPVVSVGGSSREPSVHLQLPSAALGTVKESRDATESTENADGQSPAADPTLCVFLPALATRRLHALPPLRSLATLEFVFFLLFFCVISVRFNYYLSSVFLQLTAAAGGVPPFAILDQLGYLMPSLAIPIVLASGRLIDVRGPIAGLTVLSLLSILVSALQLVPGLPIQTPAMLAFVGMRGFLFSNTNVYISVAFGFSNLGVLIGITTAIGGLIGLVAEPLKAWSMTSGWAPPNGLMLALCAMTLCFPAWLAVRGGHRNLVTALIWPQPAAR